MRKKVVIKKKDIEPDKKYSSILVRKLINKFMLSGNLRKSQAIVYQAAFLIEKKTKSPFLDVFEKALENIKPGIELRTRKMGGGRQRSIIKTSNERNTTVALQMLKNSVRETKLKNKQPISFLLAEEIENASQKNGLAFRKKENLLKEAEKSRVAAIY